VLREVTPRAKGQLDLPGLQARGVPALGLGVLSAEVAEVEVNRSPAPAHKVIPVFNDINRFQTNKLERFVLGVIFKLTIQRKSIKRVFEFCLP
jgi:hypothetical protein